MDGAEEVVPVHEQDAGGGEGGEGPGDEALGGGPAGDAEQQQVDLAAPRGAVDQVGAAEVVEAAPGHLDLQGEDRPAAVRLGAQRDLIAVGDLAREGDAPERQRRMRRRDEAQHEGAHLGDHGPGEPLGLDVAHARRIDAGAQAQRRARPRAEHLRPGVPRDGRHVERVIEVRVPHHDRVRAGRVAPHQPPLRAQRRRQAPGQRGPRHVGVDQDRRPAVLQGEPGRTQPPHQHRSRVARCPELIGSPGGNSEVHAYHPTRPGPRRRRGERGDAGPSPPREA